MLTRQQILVVLDLKSEIVPVPEWGGEVMVRPMTGTERDAYEQAVYQEREENDGCALNMRARVVAICTLGEDGKQLFTDADVEALGGKSAAPLDRIYDVVARLSRLGNAHVDELEKNSAPAPSCNSTAA